MEWVKKEDNFRVPVKSWCDEIDPGAWSQASDLARHPVVFNHVALMPDCHQGYGMPIGGVIACLDAVIPNAVGVDIGCGMGAVKSNIPVTETDQTRLRRVLDHVKERVPVGEGRAHKKRQIWGDFAKSMDEFQSREWYSGHMAELALQNLGTLGGGNHFIEIQSGDDGFVWLMIHSGSRNLGNVIARFYHKKASDLNSRWNSMIPNKDLAFLPVETEEGQAYIDDMNFALSYAAENRKRIMQKFMEAFAGEFGSAKFDDPVNIHHNYAALETHFGRSVWIHRKGATSAAEKQIGIIPGSMGAASYIVEGLGNADSFRSCSHGAGRAMGRMEASRRLTVEECDQAMSGIVFDRWNKIKRGSEKGRPDLGEAPQAYKDIDAVIKLELDLVRPIVKLRPLGVLKG